MAGTDQCYMHLMYVGNTDAQMNKVHSYYVSFLSVELFHDCSASSFFGEPKTNASTFSMLRFSLAPPAPSLK